MKKPKTLIFDIETSPLISYTWGMRDQNLGLNQIKEDWSIIAFAAKWLGDPESKMIYMDVRGQRNHRNDKKLVKKLISLLDKADIVLGQNSDKFDIKKVNARAIIHGLKPPSGYRKLDTVKMARKTFGFTSNKLEYMTAKINKKYKKLSHAKFPGMELWNQCLAGNLDAWKEMEIYNKHDVLATEELYTYLRPWDCIVDFNVYTDALERGCSCGSYDLAKNGFHFTNASRFQRYRCKKCGSEVRGKINLLSKEKKLSLRK